MAAVIETEYLSEGQRCAARMHLPQTGVGLAPYLLMVYGAAGRPPGRRALFAAEDEWVLAQWAMRKAPRWSNQVLGRSIFEMAADRPLSKAPRVPAPLLVCSAGADTTVSSLPAGVAARRAPQGRLLL